MYAAIDVDTKVVFHVLLSEHRERYPAEAVLKALKEKIHVKDTEFLVNGISYLTVLARINLRGDLNYTVRNIVEKPVQTNTLRIDRFHEKWNGNQIIEDTG